MITTKMQWVSIKTHFVILNFKVQLNFNHFQWDGWISNHMDNLEIRGWVFDTADFISSSTFRRFRAFILM